MKKLIFISIFVLIPTLRLVANAQEYQCPEGSYRIDVDACKAYPTGCAYGDSIPIEKCDQKEQANSRPTTIHSDWHGKIIGK